MAGASDRQLREFVPVEIANYKEVFEYRVKTGSPKAELVGKQAGETYALGRIIERLKANEEERRRAAKSAAPWIGSAHWVQASQDGKYALLIQLTSQAGHSDAESASVVRTADGKIVAEIRARGGIEDVAWLADANTVVLLEHTSRSKKTPWALVRLLLGHGIPLNSFYLRTINAETGGQQVVTVAEDIEYGIGCVCCGEMQTSPGSSCP